jgi:hypothetical protein
MAAITVPLTVKVSANLFWFRVALVLAYPLIRFGVVGPDTAVKLLIKCIRIKVR